MKKTKISLILLSVIFCFMILNGCAIYNSVTINDWNIVPQQATGSEIDLSLFSGSDIEFDFTIKNQSEARDLIVGNFNVILVKGINEESVSTVYFDNHRATLSFAENESRNIKLHALSSSTISENTKIVIKYDGKTVVEYDIIAR